MNTLTQTVDRLAEIQKAQQLLTDEARILEADLQTKAETLWKDRKSKSVYFSGTNGNGVTVTRTKSPKLLKTTKKGQLEKLFGKAFDTMVTEKTKCELSPEAKRLISTLILGEFCSAETTAPIDCLDLPETAKKAITKKIKGKSFDTDLKNLLAFGLDEQIASDTAYMMSEVLAFNEIENLMVLNGIKATAENINRLKETARNLIAVSQGITVTVRNRD